MRILIIGGTRFIGPAVVARLLAGGHDVTVFHRGESEGVLDDVPHIHGDRGRLAEYAGDFRSVAPDVVLDMAPMCGADAEAVMATMRGIARRVVMVSSIDVYRAYGRLHGSEPGPPEPLPLTEESPLREKLYPYRGQRAGKLDDYDKIPAERAVMSDAEVAGTVVRLPAVYGERDYQYRLFMETMRFDAKRPFIAWQAEQMRWRWSRAYAGNVAHAIALAVTDERAAGRVYNAPADAPLTQAEWLREYGRIAGWEGEIIGVPAELLPPHLKADNNYAQDMVVDGGRMRAELGYEDVVPWEEGVRRAMAWVRAHPPERLNPRWLDYSLEDAAVAELRRPRQ
jgi:nucleoside-diphosphate-sugar epimerase